MSGDFEASLQELVANAEREQSQVEAAQKQEQRSKIIAREVARTARRDQQRIFEEKVATLLSPVLADVRRNLA
jgi:restriction endonuclease Mrr